jgi:hypothetical protein
MPDFKLHELASSRGLKGKTYPLKHESKDGFGVVTPGQNECSTASNKWGTFWNCNSDVILKLNTPSFNFIVDADMYAGGSLSIFNDPINPGKKYLVVSEGAACKVRLVDISSISTPSKAKVTTIGSLVGPRAVATNDEKSSLFLIDSNNVLNEVSIAPQIPCGNKFRLFAPVLRKWGQTWSDENHQQTRQVLKVYRLKRKSAQKGKGLGARWQLQVIKKQFTQGGVKYDKDIICSKPYRGVTTSHCCVRKSAYAKKLATQYLQKNSTVMTTLAAL